MYALHNVNQYHTISTAVLFNTARPFILHTHIMLRTTKPYIVPRSFSTTPTFHLPRARLASSSSAKRLVKDLDVSKSAPDYLGLMPLAFSLRQPQGPALELPKHLRYLRDVVITSFQPIHQPQKSPPPIEGLIPSFQITPHGIIKDPEGDSSGPIQLEKAVVVACPYDGGDGYSLEAVHAVADTLQMEVMRIDLPLLLRAGSLLGESTFQYRAK